MPFAYVRGFVSFSKRIARYLLQFVNDNWPDGYELFITVLYGSRTRYVPPINHISTKFIFN